MGRNELFQKADLLVFEVLGSSNHPNGSASFAAFTRRA